MSFEKASCCAGRDRNSISFHAAAGCAERRKTTRLDPPASEIPLESPVGPGSGAVPHAFWSSAGSRVFISPMFHGPVIHIANRPRANSWKMLATSLLPATGAKPSR